jgi:hypothetical protein
LARRKAKNLLLSIDVVERAEDYCRHHGTTLSRLIEDFLERLPRATWGFPPAEAESAIVRRLTKTSHGEPGSAEDQYRDYGYEDLIRERREQLVREAEEMERRDWTK